MEKWEPVEKSGEILSCVAYSEKSGVKPPEISS